MSWLEKYEHTISAIWKANVSEEDKLADMGSIQSAYVGCADYVKSVCNHVMAIRNDSAMLAAGRIDGETYRANIQRRDSERRAMHNGLISDKNLANRLCDLYDTERIFPETEERDVVADMAGSVVLELFLVGTDRDRDQIEKAANAYKEAVKPIDKAVDEVVNQGKKIEVPKRFLEEERR